MAVGGGPGDVGTGHKGPGLDLEAGRQTTRAASTSAGEVVVGACQPPLLVVGVGDDGRVGGGKGIEHVTIARVWLAAGDGVSVGWADSELDGTTVAGGGEGGGGRERRGGGGGDESTGGRKRRGGLGGAGPQSWKGRQPEGQAAIARVLDMVMAHIGEDDRARLLCDDAGGDLPLVVGLPEDMTATDAAEVAGDSGRGGVGGQAGEGVVRVVGGVDGAVGGAQDATGATTGGAVAEAEGDDGVCGRGGDGLADGAAVAVDV